MTPSAHYRRTLISCYLGYITQAICANFAPLLFLIFQASYHISLEKITLIPTVFFLTQLLVDLAAAKFVDRAGYRRCSVAAHVLAALGLALLAFLPELLPDPFWGVLLSAVVCAVGSGLIEVLISPIVEACPFENKASHMSLLHSFYCWGAAAVILGSTLFLAVWGADRWRILALLWALIPFCNIFGFLTCPLPPLAGAGKSLGIRNLLRLPLFWLLAFLMVCSGAAETSMAQWASAFTESAMGVSKTVGDLAGPCLFALLMGLSRVLYARMGSRLNLARCMLGCGLLCICCYLLASLAPSPLLGLAAGLLALQRVCASRPQTPSL